MTTSTTSTSTGVQTPAEQGNLWQKGLIAAVVATVVNLILFGIGALAGGLSALDMTNPGAYAPVPWFMVLIMTVVPIFLGVAVYWLLRRVWPSQATRVFVIGALALAVLSTLSPILGGETLLSKILLSLMHIVAGVSLVWFTTR